MVRQFFIDLDADESTVRYFGNEPEETPQFVMHKGDSEVFLLIARAVNGRFQWYIDVRLMVNGVEIHRSAKDGSHAFVTVGYEGLDKRWWVFGEGRWVEPPW